MSADELDNIIARALYEGEMGGPSWDALLSWANGKASSQTPGSIGWRAAQARGERPFQEARQHVDLWLGRAKRVREALQAQGVMS